MCTILQKFHSIYWQSHHSHNGRQMNDGAFVGSYVGVQLQVCCSTYIIMWACICHLLRCLLFQSLLIMDALSCASSRSGVPAMPLCQTSWLPNVVGQWPSPVWLCCKFNLIYCVFIGRHSSSNPHCKLSWKQTSLRWMFLCVCEHTKLTNLSTCVSYVTLICKCKAADQRSQKMENNSVAISCIEQCLR